MRPARMPRDPDRRTLPVQRNLRHRPWMPVVQTWYGAQVIGLMIR
jgi:hypothetical protein